MWLSRHIIIFFVFSFLGWVWESIYCTLCKLKWQARGFLYGPICPIYGFGALGGVCLVEFVQANGLTPAWWQIFLVSVVGSAVLEYLTSWGLEKLFHAYWWDYSNVPLNLNGRISLPTSLGFGAAGLLIFYVLAPISQNAIASIPDFAAEIIAMLLIALISVDATLTISVLSEFDERISAFDVKFNDKMTDIVDSAIAKTSTISRFALKRVKGFRHPKFIHRKKDGK